LLLFCNLTYTNNSAKAMQNTQKVLLLSVNWIFGISFQIYEEDIVSLTNLSLLIIKNIFILQLYNHRHDILSSTDT
jgi:hypothetical protein